MDLKWNEVLGVGGVQTLWPKVSEPMSTLSRLAQGKIRALPCQACTLKSGRHQRSSAAANSPATA